MVKCVCCGEEIQDEVYYGDEGTYYEGRPLCEVCYYEDEPCAIVYYGGEYAPQGEADFPHVISYTRNETEGDFRVRWVSTDPWRGYYEAESKVYEKLHDDCILAYSRDAEELKSFDEKIRELLDKLGIRYARVFTRSSNIFSTGYDLYVHREDLKGEKAVLLAVALNILKIRYRDPLRFKITALTGKDPEDFDEKDLLLAEAYDRLTAGEDPERVQEDIIGRLRGEAVEG